MLAVEVEEVFKIHEVFHIITSFHGDREDDITIMRTNLQAARKAKGLTQEKMAEALGITLRYYKDIEAGNKLGAIDLWDKMEDALSVHQRVLRENHLDKADNP